MSKDPPPVLETISSTPLGPPANKIRVNRNLFKARRWLQGSKSQNSTSFRLNPWDWKGNSENTGKTFISITSRVNFAVSRSTEVDVSSKKRQGIHRLPRLNNLHGQGRREGQNDTNGIREQNGNLKYPRSKIPSLPPINGRMEGHKNKPYSRIRTDTGDSVASDDGCTQKTYTRVKYPDLEDKRETNGFGGIYFENNAHTNNLETSVGYRYRLGPVVKDLGWKRRHYSQSTEQLKLLNSLHVSGSQGNAGLQGRPLSARISKHTRKTTKHAPTHGRSY
ncbi:uncharacterized protein [Ptychodera flava]